MGHELGRDLGRSDLSLVGEGGSSPGMEQAFAAC